MTLEVVASASDTGGISTPRITETAGPSDWVSVVKRRRARRTKNPQNASRPRLESKPTAGAVPASVPSKGIAPLGKRRPPRTAVTITGVGENFSYASALKRARESIPLTDLGIEKSRIRRTINGERIIEIPGLDAAGKVDKLADRLRSVLGPEVVVARPSVKREIRVIGLDDTVTVEEVISAVSDFGGFRNTDIKVGSIRQMANGLGVVWAQCLLAAANKIAALKKIRIDWTTARVEILAARPLQCYKCWRFGHTRFNCGSQLDLFGSCFRCGEKGHAARECMVTPKCIVCELENLNNAHRFGATDCSFKPGPGVLETMIPADRRTMGTKSTGNG